ncbi:MAG: low temperature requirement protein A [Actinomycetia bacterium]|nr:low temperature requirement protein A [Actinomycetes bacterium]
MSNPDAVLGGTERNASTLELFFDLVYVFAITQVVSFIHSDPTIVGFAKGAFLLGLLYWAWSIYTWTTNWTGTDGAPIRLFLLAAMGATLFMGLEVPDAFGEGSVWFGIAYFAVRMLAAGFYWVASKPHPDQRAAFATFFPLSFLAALFVMIGGFLSAPWLGVLWVAAASLDVFSVINAGKGTFAIDAKHFAERFGLLVIIALGESIVGIGLAAADVPRDTIHLISLSLMFIVAAALWWSYFDKAAPFVETVFAQKQGQARGRFGRDAYSVLHFPIIVGIVFFAVAAEEVVVHPDEPLSTVMGVAMALGVALVLVSIVASVLRSLPQIFLLRIGVGIGLIIVVWVTSGISAVATAAIVAAILVIELTWEHMHHWHGAATVRSGSQGE